MAVFMRYPGRSSPVRVRLSGWAKPLAQGGQYRQEAPCARIARKLRMHDPSQWLSRRNPCSDASARGFARQFHTACLHRIPPPPGPRQDPLQDGRIRTTKKRNSLTSSVLPLPIGHCTDGGFLFPGGLAGPAASGDQNGRWPPPPPGGGPIGRRPLFPPNCGPLS